MSDLPSSPAGSLAALARHGLRQLKTRAKGLGYATDRWRYPQVFAGQLTDPAANHWIQRALEGGEPLLVGRLGRVEARLLGEARFRGGRFGRKTLQEAHRNAGVFPVEPPVLMAVADRLGAALERVDLLGFWDTEYQARLLASLPHLPDCCDLPALEPFLHPAPWTAALEGRRVLVVHPFAATIEHQYKRRRDLFADSALLPCFQLSTVVPPQTLGGSSGGHGSWLEALDGLNQQLAERHFDVALLGCGAYGLPAAAAIKARGLQALHLGGALQLLFGIRGRRWESQPRFQALMNDAWVRPAPSETPAAAGSVEGGCYW